jgi:hypothetical protein
LDDRKGHPQSKEALRAKDGSMPMLKSLFYRRRIRSGQWEKILETPSPAPDL